MRSVEQLTVPIELNRTSPTPLHEQLVLALRAAIGSGLLPAGTRLPSTRTLAGVLGISRGVAVAAYERLFAVGAIEGSSGSGTYVRERETRRAAGGGRAERVMVDLRPGQVCAEGFPLVAWRSAWRHASYDPPPAGPVPGDGLPALRAALAEHVRRVHGHTPGEAQIVLTTGPRQALDVLLRTFGAIGPRCAIADPSPRWLRDAIAARGVPAMPVPIDADGLRIDLLPPGVQVVLVAPDGDVLTGVRTSAARRAALADWARRRGWLVELAGDATTDPSARPLPSLSAQSLPERGALLGDLGQLLTPDLGLGYLVLPEHLAGTAAKRIADLREQPPLLCQRAAAELFRLGVVDRRRATLAAVHARKLALVRTMLEPIGRVEQTAVPGTARLVLPDRPAELLVADCRERGLLLTPLHEHYLQPRDAPNGVLLGFGHLSDAALSRALQGVAAAARLIDHDHAIATAHRRRERDRLGAPGPERDSSLVG
jgi:GntR family transcriptional regulator / MocR family aminotransferase